MTVDERQTDPVKFASSKVVELLAWLTVVVGALLVLFGEITRAGSQPHDVLIGLGVAFVPTGLFTLMYNHFADRLVQHVMREAIRETIRAETMELATEIREIQPLMRDALDLGVERIYPTRQKALAAFAKHLSEECSFTGDDHHAQLWIVCTSMRGFFLQLPADICSAERVISTFRRPPMTLRVLMTHPDFVGSRETSERGADTGVIESDIREALRNLKRWGVDPDCVRLHQGGPTVFGLATEHQMLLNPYPYSAEGQDSFSIVVRATRSGTEHNIYRKYFQHHFQVPWENAVPVPAEFWTPLPAPARHAVGGGYNAGLVEQHNSNGDGGDPIVPAAAEGER